MPWSEVLVLAVGLGLTGVIAGLIAGMLGVGGGIVIVPVLYWVFGPLGVDEAVRMHVAVGTSLAIIVPTSLRSTWAHYGHNGVDTELLRSLLPGLLAGVLIGIALGAVASGRFLTGLFGGVAILVAANMLRGGQPPALTRKPPGGMAAAAIGGFVGTVSTLMGIGGGTLTVPILNALRYPIHRAVGTAAAVGTIISIPGALGFGWAGSGVADRPPFSLGYVNVLGLALIAPLSVALAPAGVRMAIALNTRRLKQAFAFFLLLTASGMLYNTFVPDRGEPAPPVFGGQSAQL